MTEPYIDELPQTAGEAGFMLLTVVVMVALVLIALAVAAPVVARQLQRDREVESIHRANEYVRAIQLYQRKFPNQYPPSIKALEGTNNLRFLRHQYVDPLTGKADWRLIHQGEQKTKIHVFFGQELAGLSAGLGAAAGLQSGGTAGTAGTSSTSTIGATSPLASGFSGASLTTGTSGSTGTTGTSGATGSTGGMFGDGSGGVIVGVGPAKSGDSISQPNGQTTYDTWEFWYDPRIELLKKSVSVTGGGISSGSASGFGQSISGQPNGTTGASGATGSSGATGATGPASPFGTSPF
jgi:type II secretory pathway pseudopilin PulG